ncbi:MAG: hypothetical protein ACREOU_00490 [Candidatus Eiseniibacteriota bacterium]
MNRQARALLLTTAVFEGIVGIALLTAPSQVVSVLLGGPPVGPAGSIAAQLAGAALGALAVACWFASRDARGPAAKGLIAGVLCYNLAAAGLLLKARFGLDMDSAVLLPAAALHVVLAVWCIACIRTKVQVE